MLVKVHPITIYRNTTRLASINNIIFCGRLSGKAALFGHSDGKVYRVIGL